MVTERADTYIALSSGPVKGLVLYILLALNIHNSSMRDGYIFIGEDTCQQLLLGPFSDVVRSLEEECSKEACIGSGSGPRVTCTHRALGVLST